MPTADDEESTMPENRIHAVAKAASAARRGETGVAHTALAGFAGRFGDTGTAYIFACQQACGPDGVVMLWQCG